MSAGSETSLGRRTAGGAATMLAARGAGTAISILAMAVIARFVSPEAFGLVGMVVAILAIARVLEELGLGDRGRERAAADAGVHGVAFVRV